jgi:uncharacterized phage protein gp47/JayE
MSSGITPEGFKKKALNEILGEIEDAERARISPSLNLLPSSVFGQINGIFADKLRELWDVAQAVYRSQYPDSASGEALDNVAAITGVIRLGAAKSRVMLSVNLDDGVTLAPGRVVSVGKNGARFVTIDEVKNNTGAPGDFLVMAESQDYGLVAGWAKTIDTIQTAQSGWNSVTNPEDAELGRNEESDRELRVRRIELLRKGGTATLEAVRAKVRELEGVKQVFIFENTSLTVDADGLPPKSFEVVVSGGDDRDIARTIFLTKPVGIETFGSVAIPDVEDSQGFKHTIKFSRPNETDIFIHAIVVVNHEVFPADGIIQIQRTLADLGDTLAIGDDIIALRFRCVPLEIAGVVDVTGFKIDKVDPPVNTGNISIAKREVAKFDTGRIRITVRP